MCMPIYRALTVAAMAALAGCGAGIDVGRAAPDRVRVAEGTVVIEGPPGYCIDQGSTQEGAHGTFLLLGRCAGGFGLRTPDVGPELLTVLVSQDAGSARESAGLLGELAAYFETEAGRASLGRSGDADSVEVLSTTLTAQALHLHLRDDSAASLGLAAESWRVIFAVGDRLLTATAIAPDPGLLAPDVARALLDDFTARIRRASPGDGPV